MSTRERNIVISEIGPLKELDLSLCNQGPFLSELDYAGVQTLNTSLLTLERHYDSSRS